MIRLRKIERGEKLRHRLFFRLAPIVIGARVPDVIRSLLFRAPFWGDPQSRLVQRVMRGPSPWTPGERELFAAFCSRQFQCLF